MLEPADANQDLQLVNGVFTKRQWTEKVKFNNVELWYRIFINAVFVKHPNIPKLISFFKGSLKNAELKVEKINAGEDISCKKRKLEHFHKVVEALGLIHDTRKTDITNFLSQTPHNLAI